jgi:hypothetical protein
MSLVLDLQEQPLEESKTDAEADPEDIVEDYVTCSH